MIFKLTYTSRDNCFIPDPHESIDINTLVELLELAKKNSIIVSFEDNDHKVPNIEIYDDWRE